MTQPSKTRTVTETGNPAPGRLPVKTEDHAPSAKGGRPRASLDVGDVYRENADHPGRADGAVAYALGVSIKTYRAECERRPEIMEARLAGRAAASNELSRKVWETAQNSKNPLPLMMLANQEETRGGLGFVAGGAAKGSGPAGGVEIKITVSRGVSRDASGKVIPEGEPAIEAEFSEVGD